MSSLTVIIVSIVCFLVGGLLSYLMLRFVLKSKAESILKEAQAEAEVIKKNKLLEVKEKFLNKKADLEKEVAIRNQKIQQAENKLKQRELVLTQKQEEIQRKRSEAEAIKENLEAQLVVVDKKKDELDKLQQQEREKLETLSSLSAEEAKERLVESLKEEAKTQAASFINDIMDDAKLTANKEAKRIVIQSIQRVATETAIENSVTVFHIESDEIKGRIIGREGRNIRALEAATGVEIVVDDTPEAIVLSAFDPVRREIARLALHQLVTDGRIHPARIEEVVAKVRKQVEEEIIETGKRTTIDLGIHGLHPELIRIIGKMKSCFLQSPRAYILSGSKESGTFAIHDPEDKPGDNNRAPGMIGFCQCTGKSSLRNLLWSNKIENALQRIIFYKKSHRTAKIIYTDPRKRLCAGTDGGGKLHVQGPEHLFHCSAVRRKYKSETCYDQTGLWRTTAGLLLPGIAKIGQKAFSACIGIFIKSSRRRIISHGRSR